MKATLSDDPFGMRYDVVPRAHDFIIDFMRISQLFEIAVVIAFVPRVFISFVAFGRLETGSRDGFQQFAPGLNMTQES